MHLNDPLPPCQPLAQAIRYPQPSPPGVAFSSLRSVTGAAVGQLVKQLDGYRSELLFQASRHLDWTERLNKTASRCEPEKAGHFFIMAEEQAIAVLVESSYSDSGRRV
jgi:hypothetical protein